MTSENKAEATTLAKRNKHIFIGEDYAHLKLK